MKRTKLAITSAFILAVAFTGCKPKDSDIQSSLQAKEPSGVTVAVNDGVATLSGMVADDAASAADEKIAKDEKDVKSVTNQLTVTPPPPVVAPPASMTTVLDDATQQKVKDGMKDIPGVTVTFTADKAVLEGAVTAANRMKIMQMLSSAKVKSDVSKLTDKK